jgi:hypothetical protein
MAFTARDYRAIVYIAQRNGWKLSLCASPAVFYVSKDGSQIERDIQEVLDEYDQARKEDARYKKTQRNAPDLHVRRFS